LLILDTEATFQAELEGYLADLEASKVRTLAELIQFNKDHSDVELPEGNYHPSIDSSLALS